MGSANPSDVLAAQGDAGLDTLIGEVVKVFAGIPSDAVNMGTFWEHSLAVGIMSRELGQYARLPNADGRVTGTTRT